MDFGYTVAGFVVGTVVGLTGVGGGSLMTPLLVLVFGIHPATAVGTDLLYAAITKAGGTVTHSLKGTVDWRITGRLAAGSIPAAALTLFAISQLAPGGIGGASKAISIALGFALLLTATALMFRRRLQAFAQRHATLGERQTAVLTVVTGAILGVLVSISFGRRRRTGRHRADPALPEAFYGAHRRQRHRACRAADRGGRHRPLDARQRRLEPAGLAAARFAARHHARQPPLGEGAGPRSAADSRHACWW